MWRMLQKKVAFFYHFVQIFPTSTWHKYQHVGRCSPPKTWEVDNNITVTRLTHSVGVCPSTWMNGFKIDHIHIMHAICHMVHSYAADCWCHVVIILFVMLFRRDFGAIMHIDIHPPLYVTRPQLYSRAWCYFMCGEWAFISGGYACLCCRSTSCYIW
jgi:hypothetical protein